MTTVITIKSTAPAVVISERLGDRERHENGRDELVPGEEQSFIVHAGQSIRVEEKAADAALVLEEPVVPTPDTTDKKGAAA